MSLLLQKAFDQGAAMAQVANPPLATLNPVI